MSTTDAPTVPTATAAPSDVRGFWRILLAVIAPLPMLFIGISHVLQPADGDASFPGTVAALAGNEDRIPLLQWLQVPFLALLVPAAFAVVVVTRRRTPRLSTAGALVALTGFCAGLGILPGSVTLAALTVQHDLDAATVAEVDAVMSEHPITLIGGLLFIIGITFGLLLLGLALWRSRVAPAWMGIALALGGFTHPFIPGHVLSGLGMLVAVVGFAGASLALLRMRNEEFDLPPAERAEGDVAPGTGRPFAA